MSIFISHTADKTNKEPYLKVFSKHTPIFFGIYDKNKNFLDGKTLNFKSALPSYIRNNEIIDYAEKYEKNIEEVYNKLRKEFFDRYCYFLSRANGDYLGGIYEYMYFFRIHIKAAIRFLDENDITCLFIAPSSMGFDNVLYEVAKIKKINTVCVYQGHNNRFFWMLNWQDMGKFATSLPIFPEKKISVQRKLYDPFYMIRVLKPQKKINSFLNLFSKYVSSVEDVLRPIFYGFKLSKKMIIYTINKKYSKPADWLMHGNKSRFLSYKYINKNSINFRLSLEKNYKLNQDKVIKILFFLKVQPEATEGFSDSIYDDQSIVIDKLQSIAPPNTEIFIKEHPDEERNDPMARANFWNSISKRKNVFVLPTEETPSSLFDHFDVIATLEGSVGWEAIRNFKPVICFGRPWYLSMPGVFYIDDVSDFENILKKEWTVDDISKDFTNLTKKMAIGYVNHIESGYINASDEMTNYEPLSFNEKKEKLLKNDNIVANSLLKIFMNIKNRKEN
jgi:hypothetical protein